LAAELKKLFHIDPELIEGSNGIFDVVADGTMIFSKHQEGRFPEHEEIVQALRRRGAGTTKRQ
jgi:selT/selW/selH-like putative selenoprotein